MLTFTEWCRQPPKSHTSAVGIAKIYKLLFKLLDHPPYLRDLAPSNFFFVFSSKNCAWRTDFRQIKKITFVNNYSTERQALFRRVRKMKALLEKMCRARKKLCKKIKKLIKKKCLVLLLSRKIFRSLSTMTNLIESI